MMMICNILGIIGSKNWYRIQSQMHIATDDHAKLGTHLQQLVNITQRIDVCV